MSQLEKPFINANGRCKVKLNKKQLRAKADHESWLRAQGIHPEQLKARKTKGKKRLSPGGPVETRVVPPVSDQVGNGFVKSIFEDTRGDTPEVRAEIQRKAQRVESLYSKGPLQYVTDGTDTTMIGSKSRRG